MTHPPASFTLSRTAPSPTETGSVSRASDAAAGLSRLSAHSLTIGYDDRVITDSLSVAVPDRSFTVIVGPNACGKSTLLRGLSRLLRPRGGQVVLDGQDIHRLGARLVAKRLGLLPQSSLAPEGIRVADLVTRGRYPHQGLIQRWTAADDAAVASAMAATGVGELSGRLVDELSGGQRQRVWVAMALAQKTDILLLDEPTTYLDLAHQIDLLELLADLQAQGRTLVAVLHDLNQAARYATHLIAMKDGAIVAEGTPSDVITAELVERVYGLACRIVEDPVAGTPLVVPLGRRRDDDPAEGGPRA
ncbi:ABC transporter ATP-binding protein [Microbacterium sp. XT11]|uniref:ABC transporter ATP-binding protein n=1 Tax=Microbacterium sp. XT11 TaxID=367477 RepID=UPI000742F3AC|nr:ABC transporter ATP-binding protein [Microbacterium sp. XT11]ALX67199.1 iron-siderophore ABC transporter,ATP-binding subunit [Microbacterium sp. XT11]